tara:strand:+ start:4749 stop:6227 length:1479 start_codon:yes stop_codon:yes gene_type:complete
MAIKKYIATKDNTITNAFASNLNTRGTGSNMGFSDSVEVFSIYGQASSASLEKSRILMQFSTTAIQTDRTAGTIPASGSVEFYLRLYNAEHPFTLPRNFTLLVNPVSRSWDEGSGLDMEEYADDGYSNWISAASSSSGGITDWTAQGGDFHTGAYVAGSTLPQYSQSFVGGTENLEVNVTSLVEEWLAGGSGARSNHGVGVYLTSSQEGGSENKSFYTKKFFARGTEFFFKRPMIEARWDASRKDDARNFYLSSSLASAADNLNTLVMYNYVRGQLKNIPDVGTSAILLSVYSALGSTKINLPVGGNVGANDDLNVTGGYVATGIYTASFAYTGSATTIYPVWHSGSTEYHTGSAVTVETLLGSNTNPNPRHVSNITNLKSIYSNDEVARFRVYVRQKDWSPTIYTKATSVIKSEIIDNAYYKITRAVDNLEVIPFGTGSANFTKMSYDASGSYFDLDMELLEKDYAYELYLAYYVNGAYHEQPEVFKFRVE